jgi:hypothetical protein
MKSVVICGLWVNDYNFGMANYLAEHGEVWVLNDWYQWLPFITAPDRIWNIHPIENINSAKEHQKRYLGNWESVYNTCKCPVMVAHDIGVKNQQYINEKELLSYPVHYLGCQVSTMILSAVIEGYEGINIIGVGLNKDEYEKQAIGIISCCEEAEKQGVKVNWLIDGQYESIKSRRVNWSAIKGKLPYWQRDAEFMGKKNKIQIKTF